VDFLVAYNRSSANEQTRSVNGEMEVDTDTTNNGYALGETVITSQAANSINGQGTEQREPDVRHRWPTRSTPTSGTRRRSRTPSATRSGSSWWLKKTLFDGRWFKWDSQVLAGYSDLFQQAYDSGGGSSGNNYKSPNDLNPILYGDPGRRLARRPESITINNEIKNWDSAYYLNYYAKLFSDRVILMTGVRRDTNTSWDNAT
jgi:hypothetical protein